MRLITQHWRLSRQQIPVRHFLQLRTFAGWRDNRRYLEHRGTWHSYYIFAVAPYCGPVLGPIICWWINIRTHRLSFFFWVNMAFASVILILMGLIPETYSPVILKRRAIRLRKEIGDRNIITEQEKHKLTIRDIIRTSLIRPITMIMTEPVLDLMCMYIVLIYAILYVFFFVYPVIFWKLYSYNDGQIGLMLIPILIGAGFSLALIVPRFTRLTSSMVTKRSFDHCCG